MGIKHQKHITTLQTQTKKINDWSICNGFGSHLDLIRLSSGLLDAVFVFLSNSWFTNQKSKAGNGPVLVFSSHSSIGRASLSLSPQIFLKANLADISSTNSSIFSSSKWPLLKPSCSPRPSKRLSFQGPRQGPSWLQQTYRLFKKRTAVSLLKKFHSGSYQSDCTHSRAQA